MKPILCVVDLKESCANVLKVAATVASACHAHLIILFSYRLVGLDPIDDVSKLKPTIEGRAKEKFHEIEKKLLLKKDFTYEFQTEIGFPTDRISAYNKRKAIGMVIISEEQAHAIDENQSTSLEQFISVVNLPFLIVPQKADIEVFVDK